jgi:hypothetical protein
MHDQAHWQSGPPPLVMLLANCLRSLGPGWAFRMERISA